MLGCRQCHNKHTSGKGERKRNGAANHQLIRMMNSFPPPPKNLNRLSEKLAWITSMLKPSSKSRTMNILSSTATMKSSQFLIRNRTVQQTAYLKVYQIPTSCPPLNQRTGTHQTTTILTPKSSPVRRDCSRIPPILNERQMDFLNRSPPNEKGQNHLRIQSNR